MKERQCQMLHGNVVVKITQGLGKTAPGTLQDPTHHVLQAQEVRKVVAEEGEGQGGVDKNKPLPTYSLK